MSRQFNGNTANYLGATSAALNAYSVTLACWAYFDDNTTQKTLMHVGDGSSSGDGIVIQADGTGGGVGAITWHGGSFAASGGHSHPATGGWHHIAGVFSAASRQCYLDGSADTADTTSTSKGTWDVTQIGVWEVFSLFFYPMNGDIAAPAIWNTALSGAQISDLAGGLDPRDVASANLVEHWECYNSTSGETGTQGSLNLTETGTVGADTGNHPTLYRLSTVKPGGLQNLQRQFSANAVSRLGGLLQ